MTAGLDVPQGTGVEPAIQTGSSQKSVSRASVLMIRLICGRAARRRLL